MKVRLKKEIVTMGKPNVDPRVRAGHYIEPSDWNALISAPDVVVIDTRNEYEVGIGTFEGAINPKTKTFREFPKWWAKNKHQFKDKKWLTNLVAISFAFPAETYVQRLPVFVVGFCLSISSSPISHFIISELINFTTFL